MLSRREAMKKLLILCGSLTLASSRILRAAQPIRWGSLVRKVGTFQPSPDQHILAAVSMAIDEINAQGGILGEKVEHIVSEAADDVPSIVKVAESILNRVGFVGGGFLYPASEAVYKLSCEKRVILCEYTSRLFSYNSKCPYYFSVSITPFQMGKSLSRGIFEIFGKEPKSLSVNNF